MSSEENKTYEDLVYVEAKLLEQEHRPTHLVLNFWRRKTTWPDPKDPRREATRKAIIWRLLFSPAVLAAGGSSLVAIATIFFLNKQTTVMDHQTLVMEQQTKVVEKQNELLTEQNKKIEIQINLDEAGRRSNLVLLMDNILNQVGDELVVTKVKDSSLSGPLVGRIVALSQGFLPYKFIDDTYLDSLVLTKRLSPERGQLLLALSESQIGSVTMEKIIVNTNFKQSYLKGATLSGKFSKTLDLNDIDLTESDLSNTRLLIIEMFFAKLNNADMKSATITGVDLGFADLDFANLNCAKLTFVNFEGANLSNANLSNTTLNRIDFTNADLRNADLSDANLDNVDLNYANLQGANLYRTNLKKINFEKLKSLDSCIVHRKDWLLYITDSLNLQGAEVLRREYKTVLDQTNSKELSYRLIKK